MGIMRAGRKDAVLVFNNLLHLANAGRYPVVDFIASEEQILLRLCDGYRRPGEVGQYCGTMLRECFRAKQLATIFINSGEFFKLFEYAEMPSFANASDAFLTIKTMLLWHKHMSASFIESHYEKFMSHYGKLMKSSNYGTQLQAVTLMGELLLAREYESVMELYINDPSNLSVTIDLLNKEDGSGIQLAAYTVFKSFVWNSDRSEYTTNYLLKHKARLVAFLADLQTDQNSTQFTEERDYIIRRIQEQKSMKIMKAREERRKRRKEERLLN